MASGLLDKRRLRVALQRKDSGTPDFFPTDGYHLTRDQYWALTKALECVNEHHDGFFVSIIESSELSFLDSSWGHWRCAQPSYEEYCELPLTLENAVYSVRGAWGIMISHEMHALVGGNDAFMEVVEQCYRQENADIRELKEAWSSNPNNRWINRVLDSRRQSG